MAENTEITKTGLNNTEQKDYNNYADALEQAHKKITELTLINSRKNTTLLISIIAICILLVGGEGYYHYKCNKELEINRAKILNLQKVNKRIKTSKLFLTAMVTDSPNLLVRNAITPNDIVPSVLNLCYDNIHKAPKIEALFRECSINNNVCLVTDERH